MNKNRQYYHLQLVVLLAALLFCGGRSAAADRLTGTVIGTAECVNYATNGKTTTVNTCRNAFDGDMNTFFASWERSYTWAGLDLGEPYVITRVGWSPRNDSQGPKRVELGVFEGANREDFMDALPLWVIDERGTIGQMSYADVSCTRGFRYVRYVGPADARCNIAELEFYGYRGEGSDSCLWQVTDLPTVSIHTLNNELPYDKEHQIESWITVISDGGTQIIADNGTTRERGNASRNFPKKPWRIKFDKKQRMPGATAKAKKWTLINNYGDKTLMRNLLAFELSRRMAMPYTPYGTAVDVLMNGEYKGCYQLCDQVQVHKDRVDIEEMTPQDNSGDALTGGYLVEIDAYAYDEDVWFNSSMGNPVAIKSPDSDSITSQQTNYIMNHFNKMESLWSRYLDKNTFLRHFLVGELSGNTDTYWSVFMYKHRLNDTIYTGPVWDFDLAFDNDNRTYPVCNKSDYIYRSGGSCAGNMRSFVDRVVINNAAARAQMVEIWDEARQSGLTEDWLVGVVDSMEQALQHSQRLNFMRWPIMNTYVHQNPRLWGSYEAEVSNVRRFVRERIAWMDRRLGYTFVPRSVSSPYVDFSQPYNVYTLSGLPCDGPLEAQKPGIYIVRQGQSVRKVRR